MADISLTTSDFDNGDVNSGTSLQTLASEIESYINDGGNIDRDKLQHKYCPVSIPIFVESITQNHTMLLLKSTFPYEFVVTKVTMVSEEGNGRNRVKIQNGALEVIADTGNYLESDQTTDEVSTTNLQNATFASGATMTVTITEANIANDDDVSVVVHGKALLVS